MPRPFARQPPVLLAFALASLLSSVRVDGAAAQPASLKTLAVPRPDLSGVVRDEAAGLVEATRALVAGEAQPQVHVASD